jgi:hypothetical protein
VSFGRRCLAFLAPPAVYDTQKPFLHANKTYAHFHAFLQLRKTYKKQHKTAPRKRVTSPPIFLNNWARPSGRGSRGVYTPPQELGMIDVQRSTERALHARGPDMKDLLVGCSGYTTRQSAVFEPLSSCGAHPDIVHVLLEASAGYAKRKQLGAF